MSLPEPTSPLLPLPPSLLSPLLKTRRATVISLLRLHLISLRRHLTNPSVPLPSTPSVLPSHSLTTRKSTSFQTRTYHNATPINERHVPFASPLLTRSPPSLSMLPSPSSGSNQTSCASSLKSSPALSRTTSVVNVVISPPKRPYPFGYASYRVEDDVRQLDTGNRWHIQGEGFFEVGHDVEKVHVVVLREYVFEIGGDGRVRKARSQRNRGGRGGTGEMVKARMDNRNIANT